MDMKNQGQTPSRKKQWQKIIKIQSEEVISKIESCFAANHFSIDVRDLLAEWIEDQQWSSVTDEEIAQKFLCQMILQIRECAEKQTFLTKRRLEKAAKDIEENYGNDPLKFTKFIQSILETEGVVLEHYRQKIYPEKDEDDPSQQSAQTTDWSVSLEKLEDLSKKIQRQIEEAKTLISYQMGINAVSNGLEAEDPQVDLKESLCSMYSHLKHTSEKILENELKDWIDNQRLYGNSSETDQIDKIKKWCSKIALLIRVSQYQIKEISEHQIIKNFNLHSLFTQLFLKLLERTFIVLEQPPQIMKVNNCMDFSVCLLCGETSFIGGDPPTVTAVLISKPRETKGSVQNNTSIMNFVGDQYIAKFKKMKLTNVKRSTKTGMNVTEEKFALEFSMKVQVDDGEEKLLRVLSLPVVVISNISQEGKADGTILWDNFFGSKSPGNNVPKKVLWSEFEAMLNYKFKKEIGVSLKPENFKYFASKIFEEPIGELSTMLISWNQFWKNNIKNKDFAFWDWFFAIVKLIKGHFLDLYKNNLIMGFIEKGQSRKMLLEKKDGTFLLRFSNNKLGSISIVFKGQDTVNNNMPYTSEDFKSEALVTRVLLGKRLSYLYPDIPVKIFEKYAKAISEEEKSMIKLGYKPVGHDFTHKSDSDDEQNNSDYSNSHSTWSSVEPMDTTSTESPESAAFTFSVVEVQSSLPEIILNDDEL